MASVDQEIEGESHGVRSSETLVKTLSKLFRRSRLEVQFIIIASMVVLVLMFALGLWTTRSIEKAILKGAGTVDAGYLQAFIGPLITQENIKNRQVSPELRTKLAELLKSGPLSEHVKEIKIWNADGSLFYSASDRTVGDELSMPDLERAIAGEIMVSRAHTTKSQNPEEKFGAEYIEVYAPLVHDDAGSTILVTEFYERPNYLLNEISVAWRATMAIVLLVAVPMLGLLYLIVRSGSLLIDRQHAAILANLRHALELSRQNKRLRFAAEDARLEAGRLNEKILDQIGSDLHDGPIQILTLIKLRLSDMPVQGESLPDKVVIGRDGFAKLLQHVTGVLDEIRNISSGLVLPELDGLSLNEVVSLAVQRHADLTGQQVEVECDFAPDRIRVHLAICVYRFAQEALINAHRHAPANSLSLHYGARRGRFFIAVRDVGLAPAQSHPESERVRLGKLTQRRRIRSFGGKMRTIHRGNGTLVLAVLPLDQNDHLAAPQTALPEFN
ncbi:signal transduction histidine kinase [Rhizobium sp. BK077]|uniref:sensor histidine kinase n=1 Tax=unclassified Rhizobium TaxID=2613769 RepID=UPI00180059D6|nr:MULTISPECIES: ATP-binding protein [unclassified Rhizobium]MBB3302950.1 signal transduction histidine kinase [Rhizobium sp. BK112]MBB3371843.1 signal transduction histidine kinase [Rhizobium sp. BK077]MBB4182810.1 signal transduction histidine kinase [Rhizobium sp. BK109]